VFWPTVKADHIGGKPAVEQPVFVTASAPKLAMATPATVATPVAAPTADKASLDQLASALKTQTAKPAPSPSPAAPAPATSAPPASANSEAEACFGHGLAALAKGDVASARRWLEHAADEGENRAYVALGDAYNPAVLTRLGVLGAPGDPALARSYYNRAVAAGFDAARGRLAWLDTNAQ
jgi:TPR repeat protein